MHTERMTVLALVAALWASSVIPNAAVAGSISGSIVYDGRVPRLRPIDLRSAPQCAELHASDKLPSGKMRVGANGELIDALVRVTNPPRRKASEGSVVIGREGCLFERGLVALQTGQALVFEGRDAFAHEIEGTPKAHPEFRLEVAPEGQGSVTFAKPERPFGVQCDVHPWMTLEVAVMNHPYFAVTGPNGAFEIEGLPPGAYDVEVWHAHLGVQRRRVTVTEEPAVVEFRYRARN